MSTEQVVEAKEQKLSKKQKIKKEAISFSVIIFLVLFFRSVFFEPFKIPSGSMIPTLMIGDFILVNKFSYGFKVPFTEWFTDPVYITGPAKPQRGDVVVFKFPNDTSLNYIKRVVGLPGDTVEVINRVVYINDKPIQSVEVDGKDIMLDMDDKFKTYNFKFYKSYTGEHEHILQIHMDNYYNANFYKVTVPEGHYFVMGDNRDFSSDSRSWGYVPFSNIKGKALFVWFSMSIPWPWSEDEQDSFKFRPWRIGTVIN
ncbi:MAG: signal peptidase I [Bacteriovoracaceae bacterium]|nr:signal peptidase I [Bacteriovoracaceae bacterium]